MISFRKHEKSIIAVTLISINFVIKGIFLSSNSLAGDEPFSVYHAQMDISSIISLLSTGNNPPFYEILLHFWIKIFGISEFSVRFPSLLFSSITVLYIYKFCIRHLNKRIAVYASIVFIFSNYHILLAHEARVYALLGMLSMISMYYFMNKINSHNSNSPVYKTNSFINSTTINLIILVIVNTLLIYSHYFGFFILITQLFFIVIDKKLLIMYWKQMLILFTLLVLLYSPNILVFINRFINSSTQGTWVEKPNGIYTIIDMLRLFTNNPYGETSFNVTTNNLILKALLKAPVTMFSLAVIGISIVKIVYNKKLCYILQAHQLVLLWFCFIFIFMFGISYMIPMFLDRYLMPSAIAFSILLGISADYITGKPKCKYVVPVIICLLFVLTVKPDITNKRDVKDTIAKIKELKTSNTIIYFCPDWFDLNFAYYYNINYFKAYDDKNIKNKIHHYLHLENIFPISSYNQIDPNLSKYADKIIYLDAAANFSYPENKIKNELDACYRMVNKYEFYEIFILYEYKLK
jgi:mannosyltransferase